MTDFEFAHKFTAKWEGGFVNHPNDPGGATNYGVSLRWLKNEGIDINNDGKINIDDIRALTPDKAAFLFKQEFWTKSKCNLLPKLVATVTYDANVNVGRTQSIKFLQRACNQFKAAIDVDGILGFVTLKVVKDLPEYKLAMACIKERNKFYQSLVDNSPYEDGRDYKPFMDGWLNRTRHLEAYIVV